MLKTTLSLNFRLSRVSVEVHKIVKFAIFNTVLFTLGGDVDKILVTLLLIKQIIKDASSICI